MKTPEATHMKHQKSNIMPKNNDNKNNKAILYSQIVYWKSWGVCKRPMYMCICICICICICMYTMYILPIEQNRKGSIIKDMQVAR